MQSLEKTLFQSISAKKGQAKRFKKWYEKHREELAEKKKQRYQNDPVYREKMKLNSKRYYWYTRRKPPRVVRDVEVRFIKPDSHIRITVSDSGDLRYGMGFMIPVYFIGTVAEIVKREVQTVRLWEKRDVFLPAQYRDSSRHYRLFTWEQLRSVMLNRWVLKWPAKAIKDSPFAEAIRTDWTELGPDGIARMEKKFWRFAERKCKWCGAGQAIELYRVGSDGSGSWEEVPCFGCLEPWHGPSRAELESFKVEELQHICEKCGKAISRIKFFWPGELVSISCPDCGTTVMKEATGEAAVAKDIGDKENLGLSPEDVDEMEKEGLLKSRREKDE